jgi:hypothetical protein
MYYRITANVLQILPRYTQNKQPNQAVQLTPLARP